MMVGRRGRGGLHLVDRGVHHGVLEVRRGMGGLHRGVLEVRGGMGRRIGGEHLGVLRLGGGGGGGNR